MPTRLKHVSVGYPRRDFVDVLERNSKWNDCHFIFMPQHWGASPFGVANKITVLKAWFESGEVDLGEIVLFTDAYDTLLVQHSTQILEKFHAFACDLVISAESHFWPAEGRTAVKESFDCYDSKWRYLNSGGYIGYGWAVKALVDYCAERLSSGKWDFHKPDDQALAQRFFIEYRSSAECRVRLDTEARIFASLNTSVADFVVSKSRVLRQSNGIPTCILHANADKGNLAVLHRYWALVGGHTQEARSWDLRLIGTGAGYLSYDVSSRKLVVSEQVDGMSLVLFVKGDRQAIGLIPALGLATFTAENTVHYGGTKVAAWEILDSRSDLVTHHRSTVYDYIAPSQGETTLTIGDIPLSFLLQPLFDDLLALVQQFEHSI